MKGVTKSERTKADRPRKCYECGSSMVPRVGAYRYSECGLSRVTLANITIFECKCGAVVPEIPGIAQLHRQIAFHLVSKPSLLIGEEIKFLRQMAGLNGVALARLLGTHKTNLSKWENDSRKITKKTDSTLRLLCFAGMLQQLVKEREVVPKLANALRHLSEVDITGLLQKVRNELTGPRRISIDPAELAKFSDRPCIEGPASLQ